MRLRACPTISEPAARRPGRRLAALSSSPIALLSAPPPPCDPPSWTPLATARDRRARPSRTLAIAVAAVLATAAPASAAKAKPKPKPKPPICNLVKDTPSDAGIQGNAGGANTYDPSLDILSMDIGVTATMLTGVIRVKDLTESSLTGTTGRTWNISMSNGTATLGLSAFLSPLGGQQFNTGNGKFDFANDQIRIHATLADFPNAKIKKGAVLRGFYVTSNVVVGWDPSLNIGYAFAPFSAADATPATTAAFPVGAASCVKVGA